MCICDAPCGGYKIPKFARRKKNRDGQRGKKAFYSVPLWELIQTGIRSVLRALWNLAGREFPVSHIYLRSARLLYSVGDERNWPKRMSEHVVCPMIVSVVSNEWEWRSITVHWGKQEWNQWPFLSILTYAIMMLHPCCMVNMDIYIKKTWKEGWVENLC